MATITDEGRALKLENPDAPAESPADGIEQEPAVEPKLTPRDVIDPEGEYRLESIEQRLAIPATTFQETIRKLNLGHTRHQTIDENYVFWGRHVLEIIEKGNVPYKITAYAALLHHRKMEREAAPRLRNVIENDKVFSPELIRDFLGIDPKLVIEEYREKRLPGAYHLGSDKSGVLVRGADLVAWIENRRVNYSISELAKQLFRQRLAKKQGNVPEPEPPLFAQVKEALAREVEEREQAERGERSQAWDLYVSIVTRAFTPGDGDSAKLIELMKELELSLDRVERDRAVIERARKLSARLARNRAESRPGGMEESTLRKLAAENPDLFNRSNPPQLRGQ